MLANLLAFAGLAMTAGCGLPESSALEPIPDDEIPVELRTATTTTTTTTTTTPPEPPPTTAPPTTDPTDAPVPVVIYYAPPGVEDQMYAFPATLDPPGSLDDVVDLLTEPPSAAGDEGLRTDVRRDLIGNYSIDRGTAEVELNAQTLDFMADYQERRAIAQIVLTLTSYAPPGAGGIGQIVFVVDGEPIPVIIPGQGISDPGAGVAFEDFAGLIVDNQASTARVPGQGGPVANGTTVPPSPTGPPSTAVATTQPAN